MTINIYTNITHVSDTHFIFDYREEPLPVDRSRPMKLPISTIWGLPQILVPNTTLI